MSADLPLASQITWRISRSCDSGHCVMVARYGEQILIGNTSDPDGPVNSYTAAEWREFLNGAKRGDFDDLLA